jgi:hypothetical protein
LIWDFLGVNILSWETFGAQGVNEGGHEAQAGPILDRATRCRLALEHPMSSVFILDWSAWPKNAYIKTPPRCSLERGGGETRKREIEVVLAKIGGGNTTGVAPCNNPLL